MKILGLINDSLSTGPTGNNGHPEEKENKACSSLTVFTEPSSRLGRSWHRPVTLSPGIGHRPGVSEWSKGTFLITSVYRDAAACSDHRPFSLDLHVASPAGVSAGLAVLENARGFPFFQWLGGKGEAEVRSHRV